MTPHDITPLGVDGLCERKFKHVLGVMPFRTGHFCDHNGTLFLHGVKAKDSSGKEWTIREDTDGVYKERKAE